MDPKAEQWCVIYYHVTGTKSLKAATWVCVWGGGVSPQTAMPLWPRQAQLVWQVDIAGSTLGEADSEFSPPRACAAPLPRWMLVTREEASSSVPAPALCALHPEHVMSSAKGAYHSVLAGG